MRSRAPHLLAVLLLACACWLITSQRARPVARAPDFHVTITPIAGHGGERVGPFVLRGAWHVTANDPAFKSLSALGIGRDGRMMAVGDRARLYRFPKPGRIGPAEASDIEITFDMGNDRIGDTESLVQDPASERWWTSLENFRGIARIGPDGHNPFLQPAEMREWATNQGAEAMVRLADGRFLVISEGLSQGRDRTHAGLVFAGDPIEAPPPLPFHVAMEPDIHPVEASLLPDGRVLILGRDLILPFRFITTLSIADPAELRIGSVWHAREIARLDVPGLADNYEGMAIEQGPDGRLIVWLVSDSNESAFLQRTLLLRLEARKSALR